MDETKFIARAYGFSIPPSKKLLSELRGKNTFAFVQEAFSHMHDLTHILALAQKVGMHIPPSYRKEQECVRFFVENIRFYEQTILFKDSPKSSVQDYMLRSDPCLDYFSDDDLLAHISLREYSSRKELFAEVIRSFRVQGYFEFLCNDGKICEKGDVIRYTYAQEGKEEVKLFSLPKLIQFLSTKKLSTYAQMQLHYLVREKIAQKCNGFESIYERLYKVLPLP